MQHWTRNKKLVASWTVLILSFFTSGVILIVFSMLWKAGSKNALDKTTLRRLVITEMELNVAIVLAIFIFIAGIVGLFGFWQGLGPGNGDSSSGLVGFNWSLAATMIVTVIAGCIVWFTTLREREWYQAVWNAQSGATQAFLQDSLSCCGFYNATSAGLFTEATGFCSTIPANLTSVTPCVAPVVAYADNLLMNVFSTIYGFSAIQVLLFLTSAALIINRREEERFRRIDAKQGRKGGFV